MAKPASSLTSYDYGRHRAAHRDPLAVQWALTLLAISTIGVLLI